MHADPDKDRAGNYEPNMPIDIFDDHTFTGRRCEKSTWMNEVKVYSVMGNQGSNVVQVSLPLEEMANPSALKSCICDGVASIVEHQVTYEVPHVTGTMIVRASDRVNQTWEAKVDKSPKPNMADLMFVKRVGRAMSATLTLDRPLSNDIAQISITNDPAQYPENNFVTIINGITKADIKDILEPQYEDDLGVVTWVKGPEGAVKKIYRKRAWHFVAPQSVMDSITSTGKIVLSKAEAYEYIRKISDNSRHSGLL